MYQFYWATPISWRGSQRWVLERVVNYRYSVKHWMDSCWTTGSLEMLRWLWFNVLKRVLVYQSIHWYTSTVLTESSLHIIKPHSVALVVLQGPPPVIASTSQVVKYQYTAPIGPMVPTELVVTTMGCQVIAHCKHQYYSRRGIGNCVDRKTLNKCISDVYSLLSIVTCQWYMPCV